MFSSRIPYPLLIIRKEAFPAGQQPLSSETRRRISMLKIPQHTNRPGGNEAEIISCYMTDIWLHIFRSPLMNVIQLYDHLQMYSDDGWE